MFVAAQGNFGLRAEDAAPRIFAPRDSGRPIRVRTRREVKLAGLSPLPVALQPRRGAHPSLNNQTYSLRAKPACCDFARLALHILQHRSASSKRKPRYRLCTIIGAPDQFGDMPQGIRTGIEPLRQEARLSGPCLLYTSPSPRDLSTSRMPSSA